MNKDPRYVIVTPARNEENHIRTTLDAVINQNIRPVEWVIVDDGSTDTMGTIIEQYGQKYPWIHVIHLPDRGARSPGIGVMEAFLCGVRQLTVTDWDYIVKLDADLSFSPDYFSLCLAQFSVAPRLGIAGGSVLSRINGALVDEDRDAPRFHVRGATKIYRRECWKAIGGPMALTGWDTLDELKANMLGWQTRTLPGMHLIQERSTGAVQGVWRNALKNGRGSYIIGYHPLFMLCKCIKRMLAPIEAVGLGCGFVGGHFGRSDRVQDHALVRYLRDQQLRKLSFRSTIWQ